jgi:hypothetical protein
MYIQILNERNNLEDQGVGNLIKLRRVLGNMVMIRDQMSGIGEFVMDLELGKVGKNV